MRPVAPPSNTGLRRCEVLCQHPPYFHNGSAPTQDAVVATYNIKKSLGLAPAQAADLVQYLKSL